MKLFFILSLFLATSAFAKKQIPNLSAEILKSVSADVKKDDMVFRKNLPSRAPASVPAASQTPKDPNENIKTNQLGSPRW